MGAVCRALTDDEIANVINYLDNWRDKTLFIPGVRTGFRVSELIQMKVGDVWRLNRVTDEVTVTKAKMKGKAKGRTVTIHDQAAEFIRELITSEALKPSDFLFQSRKGSGPITRVQAWRVLKDAYNAIGANGSVATHSMRKTFASKIYELSGRDLRLTQAALGHVSVSSTVSYLAVDDNKVKDLIRKQK